MQSGIQAIDLFCGAGGLSYGLQLEGIRVMCGVDIDPDCRFPYERNIRALYIDQSVEKIDAERLRCILSTNDSSYTLLAGCAPCQTFSQYNTKSPATDGRWFLLNHFGRIVEEMRPDFVTMENVPGIREHGVYETFVATLSREGYFMDAQLIDCTRYGLAQTRTRLVLVASRLGRISILTPSEFGAEERTVRDVIGGLLPLTAGSADKVDELHVTAGLSELNLRRIRASRPNGTWRDWPRDLIAKCHRKRTGKSYPSVYGRMGWDGPAPTITTQFFGFGNGRFGHPEQDRALSLREGALLQGFPLSYQFAGDNAPSKSSIGRMIGNAVPVNLGQLIAKSFIRHIERLKNHEQK